MSAPTEERAVPPDECVRCGRETAKPWVPHLVPGATFWCDGEDPAKWASGGMQREPYDEFLNAWRRGS